jgi:chromosome segregation ATPase
LCSNAIQAVDLTDKMLTAWLTVFLSVCSESRQLSSQLSAVQGQYQQSQAVQQETYAQLTAVKAKLKAAEDAAATQQGLSQQLQQKLATAESGLTAANAKVQQLQAAHQALSEDLKRQREAWGEEESAHKNADAQVRLSDNQHTAQANSSWAWISVATRDRPPSAECVCELTDLLT